MYKYHVTMKLIPHKDGITKDMLTEDVSAANAYIVHSILFPPDGSYSHFIFSMDGKTGEPLPGHELWKAWFMMAKVLSGRKDLSQQKRDFCKQAFDAMCDYIRAAAAESDGDDSFGPEQKDGI